MNRSVWTIRRQIAAGRRSPLGTRRVLTSLVALLYLIAGGLAALHTHDAGGPGMRTAADTAIAAPNGQANLAASHVVPAKDCVVCDLLAHLVSPEPAAPALTCAVISVDIPAPPVQPHPYRPFRFSDRSSSRAPPAAVALA